MIVADHEQLASGTAESWHHIKLHTFLCEHTHTYVRAHRWQRNLADALICRLDACLSFLLAATLRYRSFGTTLELITFT